MGQFSSKEGASKGKTVQPKLQPTPAERRSALRPRKVNNLLNSKPLKKPLTYPYAKLNPAIQEIRVLKIIPGRGNEPLYCTLHHTSLVKKTLQYESISYCWGTSKAEVVIIIDGVQVAVRHSAAEVLLRMRLPNMGRVVWIDGICIDQDNVAERSQQVALMGQVYSKTVRNLIWLGGDGGFGPDVVSTLDAVLRNASSCTNGFRTFWQTTHPDRTQASNGTLLDRHINLAPLSRLFSVMWFSRVWVVQEAALAPRNLCCFGSAKFNLEDVLRAAIWLSFNRLLVPNSLKEILGLKRACNMWTLVDTKVVPRHDDRIRRENLQFLYVVTREFECTDPRDKIYGLLGMFKSGRPSGIAPPLPDYQKPLLEVFRDATRFMIQNSANLAILDSNMAVRRFGDSACASWVVDFGQDRRIDNESAQFGEFSADQRQGLRMLHPSGSPNHLSIVGVKLDVIARRTSRYEERDVQRYIAAAQKLAMSVPELRNRRNRGCHEAVAFTLIGGTNSRDMPATTEDLNDFEWLLQYLKKHSKTPPLRPDLNVLNAVKLDRETYLASRYWSALQVTSTGRCFFDTASGRIGVGSSRIQKGDVVAILYGARVPIVLRPYRGIYKLVGECYLHGVMHGEAVQEHRRKGRADQEFEIA